MRKRSISLCLSLCLTENTLLLLPAEDVQHGRRHGDSLTFWETGGFAFVHVLKPDVEQSSVHTLGSLVSAEKQPTVLKTGEQIIQFKRIKQKFKMAAIFQDSHHDHLPLSNAHYFRISNVDASPKNWY